MCVGALGERGHDRRCRERVEIVVASTGREHTKRGGVLECRGKEARGERVLS